MSYAVDKNVLPDRGSIEFWVCPVDWEGTDEKFHVFFEASDPGWLIVYKFLFPGRGLFLTSELHQTWSTAYQEIGMLKPGEWHHMAVTWSGRTTCFYLDGKPPAHFSRPQIPKGLSGRFFVGDRPWHIERNARSLVDELYIYDRPLDEKEVAWAYEHAGGRSPGQDVPKELTPPVVGVSIRPRPSKQEVVVEVEVNPRTLGNTFAGTAQIEPAVGTVPAPIRMTSARTGSAAIRSANLPAGDYVVKVEVRDGQGKVVGTFSEKLTSPGPPVWRGNKIGIPKVPPPPWTPLKVSANLGTSNTARRNSKASQPSVLPTTISCWGRTYQLGPMGLPNQITSAGAQLLASPVELRLSAGGKQVKWCAKPASLVERSSVQARLQGSAVSRVGTLDWTCTAEFDGMLRYDLTLKPAPNVSVDSMEIRARLMPAHSTLHYLFLGYPERTLRGATPAGEGTVYKANWAGYWWLGDEERGLAGFCESDEAWDRIDRDNGFRIERTADSVDAVWSFADKPRKLKQPWKFTFGLQATPVKDISGWRRWRLTPCINANVDILWTTPDVNPYYGYPQAIDPEKYKAVVKDYQAKGIQVIPYSIINAISSQAPEWLFYGEQWANGTAEGACSDVIAFDNAPVMGCSPAPDWIDFIVWANQRYVHELGLGGLYHDWTLVYPSSNRASGCGYIRDGKVRQTYPFFATRQLYKRIYTMLKDHAKATGKETFMMGHMSSFMFIPILSFCDAYLDAEHLASRVKDNYLDVMPLDHVRAEFMGHNYGVMPFFLPEFQGEYAAKPEPTQHLVGLSLLHDFALWPIYCNTEEVNRVYAVLDEFGIVDAELLPYWKNADLIGGQSDALKCSAYRKPEGGALICAVNTTRERQSPTLTVDWDRLKSSDAVEVTDALSKAPVQTDGNSVTVDIEPLNFRLLWVR